jgi:adenylate cyclase
MNRFFSELQRRKVTRVGAGYLVAGWVVLQVAGTLENALNLPSWFDTVVFALLAVGLPIALALTWFYDITPDGIVRTVGRGDGAPAKPGLTDWVLVGLLVAVAGFAVVQAFVPGEAEAPKPVVAQQESEINADPRSIAVMPFVNMSGDKENDYFSDGLTEEILNVLAQIRGLKVTSRTSAFTFKGRNVPLREVAKQLGVRHILEGSVRRAGEDVRITAQLIDVTKDVHLWSKTFERKMANIFAVQDEISTAIASALDVELTFSASAREAPTKNIEAYRLFLQARERFRQRGEVTNFESIDLYKRAIALDPKFAEAHAGLAASYTSEGSKSQPSFAEFGPLATQSARAALKLKPTLAQPYAVLGSIACDRLEWTAAIENGEKAVELDPSDSTALLWLGLTQLAVGKTDLAARSLDEAARLDPLYGFIQFWRLRVAYAAREDAKGTAIANRLVRSTAPEMAVYAYWYLAATARERGDAATAEQNFRAAMKLVGGYGEIIEPVVRALKSPEARAEATKVLRDARARDPSFEPDVLYLLTGDDDAYLDEIKRFLDAHDTTRATHLLGLAWRLPGSVWRDNPKAKPLLRAMGLFAHWNKFGAPDRCTGHGLDDYDCR